MDEKLSEFGYNYLRKLFPSVDLVYAFLRMQAMTMPTTKALNSKRLIVQEITLKKYLKGIEDLRVVYVGSAVDIEYPLLLGARKITMVDPSYKDEKNVQYIADRLNNMRPVMRNVDIRGYYMNFSFNFTGGIQNERVSVTFEPKYVEIGEYQFYRYRYEMYKPSEPIGLLLSFASGGSLFDSVELLDAVSVGGYILSDFSRHEGKDTTGFSLIASDANFALYQKV